MIVVTYIYYPYLGGNTDFIKHRLSSNLHPGKQRNQQVRSLLTHGYHTTPSSDPPYPDPVILVAGGWLAKLKQKNPIDSRSATADTPA